MEGQAAGEAQAADEDNAGDDQVAGLGQVHLVLHDVAHADGGNHAVKHEGHAANDGGGHGGDDGGELRNEGQDDGIHRRQTDDSGIIHLGQLQHAGVLAVSGVGGAAEEAGERGGKAVAQQSALKAGIFDEVALGGGGDGRDIADVLHHGGDGDGGHDQNGGHVELAHLEGRQTHPAGLGHGGEVQNGGTVRIGDAHSIQDERKHIGDQHAHQDGDDLEHSLAPDVEDDDDGQRHNGDEPVGGGIGNGGTGQGQADADDDGAGDHRGQKAHDPLDAHDLDDQCQHQIQKTGDDHAAAGIGDLVIGAHGGIGAAVQVGNGGEAAQKCEGGAEESRHLQLGAQMEDQGAHTGAEQGGGHGDAPGQRLAAGGLEIAHDQDGHQDGRAEHGEHMLETQNQRLGNAKLLEGIADPLRRDGFLFFFHNEAPFSLVNKFYRVLSYHHPPAASSISRYFPTLPCFLSTNRHRCYS